ncbi:hypothetical protein EDD16DRAFT_1702963 [Pisolithus croceorrhizus]|nr:hypothetical protein EDD16DRAFT_1702963 [Pisolithus croceorrhizus]KAI6154413.1 hypothetical protein EDD17DRAFT_1765000 [Pisolithus thermaeus]
MKSTEDIARKRAQLERCSTGHSERHVALSELAEALHGKFQEVRELDDLKEAIEPYHAALGLRPPGKKTRSLSLSELATCFSDEHESRRVNADLEDAVTLGRAASELRSLGHLDRGPHHNPPCNFRTRFRKQADIHDLEEAIKLHRAALDLRPSGHPDRFSSLRNLTLSLLDRYDNQGLVSDFKEVAVLNNAVRMPSLTGHPDRDTFLHNLAYDLTTRFKKPADMRDLEVAIELHRIALELRPSGHPRWFSSLQKLSRCLLARYSNLGVVADLEEATMLGRAALEFYPSGHPDYGTFLHDLACTLRTRFKEQTDIRDLQEAIELHRLILEIRPSEHPDRFSSLQNLAVCLSDRYDNAGVAADLAEAVTLGRAALELRPPGHPNRDISLHDLACNLRTRFEKQVTMEDLEGAIVLHRAALELRPSGHPLRFSSLQNLALCLSDRYDNLGITADFTVATTPGRAARTTHPPEHTGRDTADLDEAIALEQEAVRLLPPGDHRYGISLQRLTVRLEKKTRLRVMESQFDYNTSEQSALSTSPTEKIPIDEHDIVVAVVGPTGSGKSTASIARAPGMSVTYDLTSCTKGVRAVRYPHPDGVRNVILIDTPGFDYAFMTDVQVLQRLAHWLKSTYEESIKLRGVLYLHRISDLQVVGMPPMNYNMFKELCGRDNFKNVILVTTMWDDVTEEVGLARERELHSDFWGAMIVLGSTTHRFEGTSESAWKIINSLFIPLLASSRLVNNPNSFGSDLAEIRKWLSRDRQRTSSVITCGPGFLRRELFSIGSTFSSDSSTVGRSVGTGIISTNISGTCSVEGYESVLGQVISALRASLGTAELVGIHYLKNAIAPSLSLALFIETTTGTHHALFQVLEAATLLINLVIDHAKEAKLSTNVKTAVNAFAKEMNSVQGIIQSVAQRNPEMRRVLEPTDVRIISSCASSMRLVCDVLRSIPSATYRLRSVDDGLEALRRSLEINCCSCGVPREPEQPDSPVSDASD